MGCWKDYGNGWNKSGWKSSWGQSQGQAKQAKPAQNQSWGDWLCGTCNNQQSGSQCKKCKCKWWEVQWTKAEQSKAGKPPKSQATAQAKPKDDIVRLLDMLLAEGGHASTPMHTLAAEIREGLTSAEPKLSRNNRLKSVLDKLTHKKTALTAAKATLKSVQQMLTDAEKNHDNLAIEVASLEQERTDLANQVVNQVDTDSEEETAAEQQGPAAAQPSGANTESTEGQAQPRWTPVPKAKAWNYQQRFTQMSEHELQDLLRRARREAKRRRIDSTEEEEECDEEAVDEDGEQWDCSAPDMED